MNDPTEQLRQEHLGKVLEMTQVALEKADLQSPFLRGVVAGYRESERAQLIEALQVAAEALDNYADVVDQESGEDGPSVAPNEAMRALEVVRAALDKAGVKS